MRSDSILQQGTITLVLGGVRSGKSRFAQNLAARVGGFTGVDESARRQVRHNDVLDVGGPAYRRNPTAFFDRHSRRKIGCPSIPRTRAMSQYSFKQGHLIVAVLVLSLALSGCRSNEHVATEKEAQQLIDKDVSSDSEATGKFSVTVVDRVGRSVTFEGVPERIVSLSPSTTELMFALGAGSSIVGATKHCNYPAEALEIPRVGSGTMEGISREAILALKPDLVLCKWDTHEPLMELFDRVGIQVINLGPETLEELFGEAKLLGRVTGRDQAAETLVQQMTERRQRLSERVAALAPNQLRTVFYEVWDDPLMTAGPKSFIGEILKVGRMKNIFDDTDVRYPRISSEVVVDRNPDVILAPTNHMKQVEFERLAARPGWANIKAITNKQVFIINGDEVSRCGPRLLNALEQMIDAVYPETKVKEVNQP